MSFEGLKNTLWRNYDSFHISHDGEGDDIQALIIANSSIKEKNVQVDCVIGNPLIIHSPAPQDKEQEMLARMQLTDQIFGKTIAMSGAKSNSEVSSQYVEGILKQSESKNCLVLHTDSFKSLRELFNRSMPGQLKNVVILAYGSINITWAMQNSEKEEADGAVYKQFYDSLAKSGAKLVQVDAFPFLKRRHIIKPSITPVTGMLLPLLDGPIGMKLNEVNREASERIRNQQGEIIAENICKAIKTATEEKANELKGLIDNLPHMEGHELNDELFNEPDRLSKLLNRSLDAEQHKRFDPIIKKVGVVLAAILGENLDRNVSVYANTSLQGQALIADQIPAIIFSELIEGRKNGLLKECLPVQFDRLDEKHLKFAVNREQTSLFYFNTEEKLKLSPSGNSEEKQIDAYLQYIDLCMASALLAHEKTIDPSNKEKLMSSSVRVNLENLAEKVKGLGFDLPKSYFELFQPKL